MSQSSSSGAIEPQAEIGVMLSPLQMFFISGDVSFSSDSVPSGGNVRAGFYLQPMRGLDLGLGAGISGLSAPLFSLGTFERLYIIRHLYIGLGQSLTPSNGAVGLSFSLGYLFGFPDADGDWIRNNSDRCPHTPSGSRVDSRGCGIDSDGDGVFDGIDRCPHTPFQAFVDSTGCPTDSDDDGVFDGVDLCQGTPDGILVDSVGCPRDSDRDGIPDYADSCGGTPKGALVDSRGCSSDSDEDGVLDGIDNCPGTPTGFKVDRFGCPYVMPITSEIISDVFDNSLNLKGDALNRLKRVAERIRAYPNRTVLITVYTDGEGSPRYNINRSSKVGEKIKEFLVSEGVVEKQIIMKAGGESKLISNAGIAKNRRVEIKQIKEK